MKYHNVIQGEEEWFIARRGIPTASRFDMILTPAQAKPSKQQDTLINELIGERLSLIPPEGAENFTNRAMRWGLQCEQEARDYYALQRELEQFNGGFCTTDDGRFGASPDSLIGTFEKTLGALELKCPQATTHVGYLRDGVLPVEYRWQCHGHLIVTGLPWVDFESYCPGLPTLLVRVEPNEDTKLLAAELERFHEKFMKALRLIQERA